MDTDLIQRYQPGGDLYAQILQSYGTNAAQAIANAASTGDQAAVNAAFAAWTTGKPGEYTPALDSSTADAFYNEVTTDPLAAPLSGLNNIFGNSIASLLQNKYVLGIGIAAVALYFFGDEIKSAAKSVFKK